VSLSLHSVLPFVLLGIGVDNCFVLVNAFSQTNPAHSIVERSAESLRHAGASITVTSATDVVAFAVGSKTSLPALSSFCAYATFAILFQYLFNITYFQSCIVLNAKRQSTNTYDCCCCFSSSKPRVASDSKVVNKGERHNQSRVSKFLEHTYGPCVTSIAGGVLIMSVTLGMLVLGVYGWGELEVASAEANFIPDSSYAKTTLDIGDKYYKGVTNQAFVVVKVGVASKCSVG
jgi:predicted RND superfamily exporter protein